MFKLDTGLFFNSKWSFKSPCAALAGNIHFELLFISKIIFALNLFFLSLIESFGLIKILVKFIIHFLYSRNSTFILSIFD